jgi:hypothetical protein
MATEFPQQQVDPTAGPEDTEGSVVDLLDEMGTEVEETADGGAIIKLRDEIKGPIEEEDFYGNMAEWYDKTDLAKLGNRYMELIEKDKEAREERDKQYEEGLRRTGLGNDAPGGAQFMGANKVVHPIMAEACVDFESRAIKELFPADGPVRTNIIGDQTDDKIEIAERKRDYMNWQLTEQIVEFRDELEQMLTQLPLGGSQYMKMWYDEQKKRPCVEFIPIDNIYMPYSAVNFYTAQRVTEVNDITHWEFDRRVKRGMYLDIDVTMSVEEPQESRAKKANDKIEGRRFDDNVDGTRRVYHTYCHLELDDDKNTEGESAPYILMLDEDTSDVIGLYRNWEEKDETLTKLDHIIEFKFIPWRGAYAIGFPHLIGGLAAALTGSLRALLDTAHINNSATMLKLKGAKISGQSAQIDITQVTDIEGAPGVDDVRKIAMPMPFNPPSPVLFQLLGWLTDAAKGVVTTSEEKIADINNNAPVGTTQALIEQGAAVYSAIHARLHNSQARMLKILSRINKWYLDEQIKGEIVEELEVQRTDFTYTTDVIPVSDPHIFSETQRMAQTQAVLALDQQYPGIMDRQAIVQRALKQFKIPNIKELMPNAPEPEELNAAEENVAMSLGRPAFAYVHQNHLAHLQTHLDYAKNPVYGTNPLIAPSFQPRALEHLKQHLVLWYSNQMRQYVEGALGQPVSDYDIPAITSQVDKLFALSSQHVNEDSQQVFEKVLPVLQAMVQQAAQYKPEPQLESSDQALLKAAMAETERKKARDEADIALKAQQDQANNIIKTREQQIKVSLNAIDNLTDERIQTEQHGLNESRLAHDQTQGMLQTGLEHAKMQHGQAKDVAQHGLEQDRFKHEQFQTALNALQSAQSNQGEKNGSSGPSNK